MRLGLGDRELACVYVMNTIDKIITTLQQAHITYFIGMQIIKINSEDYGLIKGLIGKLLLPGWAIVKTQGQITLLL